MYIVCNPSTFRVKCKINIFSSEKSQVLGKTLHGREKVCGIFVLPHISGMPLSVSICVRSESAMSRKGIGDRVKAKTNVATVRLASALGFQVLHLDHDNNILDNNNLSAREAGHGAVSHQHAGHRLRA